MRRTLRNLQLIYTNYRVIPFFLCISVAIDYALTLYLAGSRETIQQYEFSPLLRYAMEHNLVIIYLVFHAVKIGLDFFSISKLPPYPPPRLV